MIESVHFKNFKALRDVELNLERFTVLVGPNASGKTSVLEGLYRLSMLGAEDWTKVFVGRFGESVIRTRGADGPIQLTMSCRWQEHYGSLKFSTPPFEMPGDPAKGRYHVLGEWGKKEFPFFLAAPQRPPSVHLYRNYLTDSSTLAQVICSALLLRFDPDRLAEASYTESETSHVECDGYGLPSVLADMALAAPDDFQAVQAGIKAVVPGLRRVRMPRTNIRYTKLEPAGAAGHFREVPHSAEGHAMIADFLGAEGIPAHSLSEGTLIVIGLLSVLTSASRPRLLLLDNIERGLHPKAMGEFIAQIRRILNQYPDLQIVATTHSPYLLDHFDPKEIRLCLVDPQSGASCAAMTEHPEFDKWKDAMAPGEFWSTVGEDWIKDRKPPAHE